MHGANRLASNSLLEGLVFGARAVAAGWRYLQQSMEQPLRITGYLDGRQDWTSLTADLYDWRETAERVRAIMWDKVGIIRHAQGLAQAAVELDRIDREIASLAPTRSAVEAVNLLTLSRLAVAAAKMRTESRGGHFRSDFPSRDDVFWLRHIIFEA